MTRLTIRHETRYIYDRPVSFDVHRLLLRPRDSHAIRLVEATLTFSPQGETRWVYDALGNCVCLLAPAGEASSLTIVSDLVIARFPAPLAPAAVDDPRTAMPMAYDLADRAVLAPFLAPTTEDPDGQLLKWIRGRVARPDQPALDLLLDLTRHIREQFAYGERFELGAQDPVVTLARGAGACRDFAWLMVEALRLLGYAARFVTGYLYSPGNSGIRGAGATHAWCEVFLPHLGWTEFDPTNGLAESPDLIPVAMARTPAEASPVSGAIFGDPGRSELSVHVDVRLADTISAAA